MPYSIESNGDGTYRVVNAITGKVHAKRTSKEKAEKQVRVMEAAEHGGLRFKRARRNLHRNADLAEPSGIGNLHSYRVG